VKFPDMDSDFMKAFLKEEESNPALENYNAFFRERVPAIHRDWELFKEMAAKHRGWDEIELHQSGKVKEEHIPKEWLKEDN